METAANLGSAVQAAIELDAPLNERLKLVANAVRHFQPDRADAVDRLVDRLLEQRVGSTAPKVGDSLPNFLLSDDVGRLTSLTELLAQGPTVVSFQRGHWCPYCRTSAVSIAAAQDKIAAAGGRIVVIVPERAEFALKLKQSSSANFPILSDIDNGYALSLNLAVWVGDEMEGHMAEAGVDLPRFNGNQTWFLPVPAVFVVRPDGIVVARHVDPDYRRRMEVDEIVKAVKSAKASH